MIVTQEGDGDVQADDVNDIGADNQDEVFYD